MRDNKINLPCWVYFLADLDKDHNYASNISRKCDITYSHTVNVLSGMEILGWINKEKQGRRAIYTLTKTGKELSIHCTTLLKLLKENRKNQISGEIISLKL